MSAIKFIVKFTLAIIFIIIILSYLLLFVIPFEYSFHNILKNHNIISYDKIKGNLNNLKIEKLYYNNSLVGDIELKKNNLNFFPLVATYEINYNHPHVNIVTNADIKTDKIIFHEADVNSDYNILGDNLTTIFNAKISKIIFDYNKNCSYAEGEIFSNIKFLSKLIETKIGTISCEENDVIANLNGRILSYEIKGNLRVEELYEYKLVIRTKNMLKDISIFDNLNIKKEGDYYIYEKSGKLY